MEANETLDDFASQIDGLLSDAGSTLIRFQQGHSDRSFAIIQGSDRMLRFTAKVSLISPPFWGLGIQKASEMIEPPGEYLLLLTAADSGYLINPSRLRVLIPKFGKDRVDRDYKINAGKVRREWFFSQRSRPLLRT